LFYQAIRVILIIMKSVLSYIAVYLAACVCGSVALAGFYMLYTACTSFVCGVSLPVFSASAFVHGLVLFFPASLFLSTMLLALYRIRHPKGIVIPVVCYVVLGIITWALLLPFGIRQFTENSSVLHVEHVLQSPGYFRKNGDFLYYYTSVSKSDKTVSGIYIKQNVDNGTGGIVYPFKDASLQNKLPELYADPLIRDSLPVPPLLDKISGVFTILLLAASSAVSSGWLGWGFFASLGFALLCTYSLIQVTSWRLLNSFLVVFTTSVLFLVNSLYYGTVLFVAPETKMNTFIVRMLSAHVPHIPFITIVNLVCAFVFLTIGIISLIRHHGEQEE